MRGRYCVGWSAYASSDHSNFYALDNDDGVMYDVSYAIEALYDITYITNHKSSSDNFGVSDYA